VGGQSYWPFCPLNAQHSWAAQRGWASTLNSTEEVFSSTLVSKSIVGCTCFVYLFLVFTRKYQPCRSLVERASLRPKCHITGGGFLLLNKQKPPLTRRSPRAKMLIPDRVPHSTWQDFPSSPQRGASYFAGAVALWHWDTKVFASLAGELVYNLDMSWHRRCPSVGWIPILRVLFALAQQFAAIPPEMLEQSASFIT
jgi:hypothetical protein